MLAAFAKSIAPDGTIAIVLTYLFNLLFFLTPLIFWPRTSEVFEFNKMLFVYGIAVLVMVAWGIKTIAHKKFIFRRTILDIPLLLFLVSQIISTLISIDTHTSIFGYYSRFHGGLLSSVSYALLYWAFVSNMNFEKTKRAIVWLMTSGLIVSVYGILEHFGASPSCLIITKEFNNECWVQDVQLRVFATIGQPNWLAAYLTAIIPISWWLSFKAKFEKPKLKQIIKLDLQNSLVWWGVSTIFFLATLFTKSRSGLLGFTAAFAIFWGLVALISKKEPKRFGKRFLLFASTYFVITALVGTPWSPSVGQLLNNQQESVSQAPTAPVISTGTVLETGGTESGDIRKIVWSGALAITKSKPFFGTGLETFAFSYYQFRPNAHNLVSEWDFLYNKAHNEFLNFGANSGLLGLLSLGILISVSGYIFAKGYIFIVLESKSKGKDVQANSLTFNLSLLAGFTSILITNFFGFSVVPVAVLFFLFPALAVASSNSHIPRQKIVFSKLKNREKAAVFTLVFIGLYLLMAIFNYWRADLAYAKGKRLRKQTRLEESLKSLQTATKIRPREPIYIDELSRTQADLAVAFNQTDEKVSELFVQEALSNSNRAFTISPRNINLRRSRASTFLKLARIDENYLLDALELFLATVPLAPSDPKILYQMGLTLTRAGQLQQAIGAMNGAIDLKPNYKDARFALGLLYEDGKKTLMAIEQYEYILSNISPDDQLVQEQLQGLKKP